MTNEPWRIGPLLGACGFTETASIQPFDHIEHTPGTAAVHTSFDFEDGEYPVMTVSTNIQRMIEIVKVLRQARRVGDILFSDEVLDQLNAAGCTLEDREDGGITIHMPDSGEIPGDPSIVQAMSAGKLFARELRREVMFFPIAGPRDVHSGPDYLKHDLTKRHSRKRPTTKRNKRR